MKSYLSRPALGLSICNVMNAKSYESDNILMHSIKDSVTFSLEGKFISPDAGQHAVFLPPCLERVGKNSGNMCIKNDFAERLVFFGEFIKVFSSLGVEFEIFGHVYKSRSFLICDTKLAPSTSATLWERRPARMAFSSSPFSK